MMATVDVDLRRIPDRDQRSSASNNPAGTNGMANDRRSTDGGALSRPTEDEYMQLVRLPSRRK